MKNFVIILVSVLFLSLTPELICKDFNADEITYFNYNTLYINNIHISINNTGDLYPPYDMGGAFWNLLGNPYYSGSKIVWDQGLWVVAKIGNEPQWTFAEWTSYYSPGPIIDGQAAMVLNPQDSLRYRVYKISKDDDISNPDLADWPADLGAPVDKNGDPIVFGDQTIWTIYNGADETLSSRDWFNEHRDGLPPVPLEIQQTAFAHKTNPLDSSDTFSNCIFFEWTIINKGSQQLDSTFIGLWTDIDFLSAWDNLPAVDTLQQLGYCWSELPSEQIAPAVGYSLLYGPVEPSPGDTAIFKGRKILNYKNLPMTSFHPIGDDSISDTLLGPIRYREEAWNVAKGLSSNGFPIIDPITSEITKFPYSGDPVTESGWWQFPQDWASGGAGFVFFSGPFDFAPNDTQWVMIALVPGLGTDRIDSIVKMRENCSYLHSLPYDSLARKTANTTNVNSLKKQKHINYQLFQNYPNPFNASTTIQFQIPDQEFVELKIFNINGKEIATLIKENMSVGLYQTVFNMENLSSGVYFYQLKAGSFIETKKFLLLK